MGFGGKTTVLGTKITHLNRLPASFFVSVSYMCWAYRRRKMMVQGDQVHYCIKGGCHAYHSICPQT